MRAVIFAAVVAIAFAQMSSLGTGQTSSTACTLASGNCATDGSSNYIDRSSLSYNSTTGKFSGSMTLNQCPEKFGTFSDGTAAFSPTAICVTQTVPAAASYVGPAAAPLRNAVGFSLYGANIYGPMEAGFTAGQACSVNLGTCDAGTDVPTCEAKLEKECGTSQLSVSKFMDSCGGHASPYHYHKDLSCEYTTTSGHSTMVGLALDGNGIYGMYESTGTKPSNLDYCGGHVGDTPATTVGGTTYAAATGVYHYHTQSKAPYTLGCYGPVATLTACKALYSTCEGTTSTYCTSEGSIAYDLDCPCFQSGASTETYNMAFTSTSSCTSCEGNCAAQSVSSSSSSSSSSTPVPDAVKIGVGVGIGVGVPVVVAAILLTYCCCKSRSSYAKDLQKAQTAQAAPQQRAAAPQTYDEGSYTGYSEGDSYGGEGYSGEDEGEGDEEY